MRSFTLLVAAFAANAFAGPLSVADDPVEIIRRDAATSGLTVAAPTSTSSTTTASGTTDSQVSFVKRQRGRDGPGRPGDGKPGSPPGQAGPPGTSLVTKPSTTKTTTTKKTTTKKTTTKKTTTKRRTTTKKTPAKSTQKAIPAGPTATTYQQAVVNHHNYHRANHSAPNIKWSPRMASIARKIAQSCVYAHDVQTGGGGYGQNIAAGAPASDIAGVITNQFYNNEVILYPKFGTDNPDITDFHAWGHFSQVVWKGTTHVGCYTLDCSKKKGGLKNISDQYSNIAPTFTVCNYWPPGNYQGEYKNVGKSINRQTVDGNFRVNQKNIKSPNPPPLSYFKGQTTG